MLFLAGSFLAATHDIAIDGYYLETLDTRQQARFIGYRVMTYRIAMMAGAGVIATIGTTKGWTMAFGGSALILALFSVYHLRYLPQSETARLPLTILLPKPATGRLLRLACAAALALIAVHLYDQTILAQGLLLLQLFFAQDQAGRADRHASGRRTHHYRRPEKKN